MSDTLNQQRDMNTLAKFLRPALVLTLALMMAESSNALLRAATPNHESVGAAEPATDASIYGEGVRSTPWRTPAEERSGFHLPPGFEIRLFAAEPQIAKPLNMAFDDRGRMWVTQSVEYPYPAKEGEAGRDAVVILEDTDADGLADRTTTFADGLNIPIGVLPYGQGCLCFSIPNLWYLRDTDGDGKCDKRDVVLGPFDTTRDTHGMINSLRDGGDGWIYACHGFNNQSEVAGSDGHTVVMHSGNTFRFRPDGSRVEHVTHGQVNPFGMTEDEWGYRYSADCHSKPITQLIRGGCYPSFGRPHDGLGFLPPTVEHLHGSTAISGILYVPSYSPIEPLRGQLLSGNVMTSRLNRNQLVYEGATAKGQELPDFLTCDDPWFRPVDIQLGPDGHIYVADFYNKIIGHYEVPLDHPERDRTSGRIWQIRYQGDETTSPDIAWDDDSARRVAGATSESPHQRVAALRYLAREKLLDDGLITLLLADESDHVRVAALHVAAENLGEGFSDYRYAARKALDDVNPHVALAAAELLGVHGGELDVARLRGRLAATPSSDPVLRQALRIAIRDRLRDARGEGDIWSEMPDAELASILLGIDRPEVCRVLLEYLSAHPDVDNRDALLSHAAKNATADLLDQCVRTAKQITGEDPDKQFVLLDVLCQSQNARPGKVAGPLRDWAVELVDSQLAQIDAAEKLVSWNTGDGGDWPRQARQRSDGEEAMLVSSFGRGETYTGRIVSDPFPAPGEIRFWIAGHNGPPDETDHGKNRIRLLLADTGEVVHETAPPRNDVAQQVVWDNGSIVGRTVRIECIDEDSANAFAWVAFGGVEPDWIHDSRSSKALRTSLDWIQRLGIDERAASLESMLGDPRFSPRLRGEVAGTLATLRHDHDAAVVLQFLRKTNAPTELVESTIDSCLARDRDAMLESAKSLCKRLSSVQQREFATAWAKDGAEMETLVNMAERGWLSPEVFVDASAEQAITPRLSETEKTRVATMTQDIDINAQQSERLSELQEALAARTGDLEKGKLLYTQHCAACHQLRGSGAVVGPQLDGAATRSPQRLLEDIVTPDRNVDQAFRTTSFLLDDGRVLVGLVTSETAAEVTVVESNGKPITIDPESIEQRREAGRSLMPSNMSEVLSAEQFGDLITFIRGS